MPTGGNGKGTVYFQGIPTRLDVEALEKVFGIPKDGDIIQYSAISGVIGTEWGKSRWRTVVAAWRRTLFGKYNIVMDPTFERSFIVLDPERRVGHTVKKYNVGRRFIRRAAKVALSTNRSGLSQESEHTLDHVVFVDTTFRQHSLTAARKLGKREALAG